jgi:hypothetical protein
VFTVFGPVKLLVLTVEEGKKARIGKNYHISPLSAVSTVWASFRYESLTAKTQTASPSLSGYNFNAGLIYEFQNGTIEKAIVRRVSCSHGKKHYRVGLG